MNISGALRRLLPSESLEALARAADACARVNAAVYLVGGSVRDTLLGHTDQIADVDLVLTEADTSTVDFIAAQIGEVTSRSEFMTLKVRSGNLHIDLVRARSETYVSPGALPEVRPGSLVQDLARRDFSINAMAVSLEPGRWGELIDPHGGRQDLEHRQVRMLHDRSFEDDPTRMFRAVRYAVRLGFDISPDTRASLKANLARIELLSGDRIRHEVEHIFAEPRALSVLALAGDEGILREVHPALALKSSASGRLRDSDLPVDERRGAVLLAALVWDVSSADRLAIANRLRLGASWSRVVAEVVELRDIEDWPSVDSIAPSRIRERLAGYSDAALEACALLTTRVSLRTSIRLYLDRLRQVKPLLTGTDLIALGTPEGPRVGQLLDQLRDARLDGMLTTSQDEERWVLEQLDEPTP